MKKIGIITAAILIAILQTTPKVWANHDDPSDIIWYTVSELLEYKEQIDKEFDETCGNDLVCIKDLHCEKKQEDPKYAALYILEARNFLITAINHKTKTFKMLFFDERLDVKKGLGGKTTKLILKDAYISWTEEVAVGRHFDNEYSRNLELYHNNQIEGAHLMLSRRANIDGVGWFSDYNKEVEYQMADNVESAKNSGTILFDLRAVSGLNTSGKIGYSGCLKSEKYREEYGCTLMVSSDKQADFFPIEAPEIEEYQPEDPAPISTPTPTPVPVINPIPNSYTSREHDKSTSPKNSSIIQTPKAPNTGNSFCNQKTIEFPWWLVIIIALADAVVLWLFWPNGKNNKQKH